MDTGRHKFCSENLSHSLDSETQLFSALLELHHGRKVEENIKKISLKVPWARGWPNDTIAFWNAEAFLDRKSVV